MSISKIFHKNDTLFLRQYLLHPSLAPTLCRGQDDLELPILLCHLRFTQYWGQIDLGHRPTSLLFLFLLFLFLSIPSFLSPPPLFPKCSTQTGNMFLRTTGLFFTFLGMDSGPVHARQVLQLGAASPAFRRRV